MDEKACSKCKIVKPVGEFYSDRFTGTGYSCWCRECQREHSSRRRNPVSVTEKVCIRCEVTKPASEFYLDKRKADGLYSWCKQCSRAVYWKDPKKAMSEYRRRKYGVSQEDYDRMLVEQNGVCKICRRSPTDTKCGSLHIDHDHKTGGVRGLLCRTCNQALGQMSDRPDWLRAAAAYLESFIE